jgi:mannose-6-phosphate isomerase-like protein (cupin superfamily)
MQITSYASSEKMKNPHGINACKLYDTRFAEMIHISLAPGEALVKHITPVDAVFYVLEGEASIEIGDEQEIVKADSLVNSPQGIPHRISNNSKQSLRVLVIKLPRPTEKTVIIKE